MRNSKGQFVKGNPSPKYWKGKTHGKEYKEKMSTLAKEKGFGKWMAGKKASEETKKKMSIKNKGRVGYWKGKKISFEVIEKRKKSSIGKQIGSLNHNWKGGITPINMKIRNSIEYKLWRRAVFERDRFTCIWCKIKSNKKNPIHADHIKPFSLYPELRFSIDNGRTLCVACHRKTNTWGGKIKKYAKLSTSRE